MSDVAANLDLASLVSELENFYGAYETYLTARTQTLADGQVAAPEITDYLSDSTLQFANLSSAARMSSSYNHSIMWGYIVDALQRIEALKREAGLATRTKAQYYAQAADSSAVDAEYEKRKVIEERQYIKGLGL